MSLLPRFILTLVAATILTPVSTAPAASVAINPVDADTIKPYQNNNYNSKSYIYSYYENEAVNKHTAFMKFDLSGIDDDAEITGMTLKMSTELIVLPAANASIYRGDNDNWSSTTQDNYPGTNELVGNPQLINGFFTYYTWTLNVGAVDWTEDLTDNILTLAINSPGYANWFALDGKNPTRYPLLTIDYEEGIPLLPGDANHDGYVDGGDYTIWADHYLQTGQTWETGDFTGEGLVDGGDYTIWADNYDPAPAMASAIPEPSTWALAMIGLLGIVGYGTCRSMRRTRVDTRG